MCVCVCVCVCEREGERERERERIQHKKCACWYVSVFACFFLLDINEIILSSTGDFSFKCVNMNANISFKVFQNIYMNLCSFV